MLGVIIAGNVFGVTPPELFGIAAIAAYVVSLAKDWRPVKTLRAENRDLRQMLEEAEKKIDSLEQQVAVLQKATDLTSLLEEHKKIAHVLDMVVDKLESLDRAVQAKAASIEALARWAALKQNLDDMKGTPT